MSRISKLLCSALILSFLSFPARTEQTLIAPEDIVTGGANYKTAEVVTGNYVKRFQTSATVWYPLQYRVCYEGPAARYGNFYVKRGDSVKQGDLLASFTVEADGTELYRDALELTRAREKRDAGMEQYDREIEELRARYAAEADAFEREDLRLQIGIRELEREKYDLTSRRELDELEKQAEKREAESKTQYVYAPCDGMVSEIAHMRSHEEVSRGIYLMTLSDRSVIRFTVQDKNGVLRCGTEVSVELGSNVDRLTSQGRVAACASALPGTDGNTAVIEVGGFGDSIPENLSRPMVYCTYVYVSGVPVAPTNAITVENGKYFVYKLSGDGTVSKRNVLYAPGDSAAGSWILSGAEPGEILIIN